MILYCDFFNRQDLQEGASYFKRVLWDTDVNKRIVISVELSLHESLLSVLMFRNSIISFEHLQAAIQSDLYCT